MKHSLKNTENRCSYSSEIAVSMMRSVKSMLLGMHTSSIHIVLPGVWLGFLLQLWGSWSAWALRRFEASENRGRQGSGLGAMESRGTERRKEGSSESGGDRDGG